MTKRAKTPCRSIAVDLREVVLEVGGGVDQEIDLELGLRGRRPIRVEAARAQDVDGAGEQRAGADGHRGHERRHRQPEPLVVGDERLDRLEDPQRADGERDHERDQRLEPPSAA
ncbi:MAG: hypothetical protein U0610_01520 [bacterium]